MENRKKAIESPLSMQLWSVEESTMMVTLQHKTKKGKERIKRDGADKWFVRKTRQRVAFSPEKGPWLLIDNGNSASMRWVHATRDRDFVVEECVL